MTFWKEKKEEKEMKNKHIYYLEEQKKSVFKDKCPNNTMG